MREKIEPLNMTAWEEWRRMVRYPYITGWLCTAWSKSFDNFLRDMGRPPRGKRLLRWEAKEKFCKENCYWG